MAWLNCPWCGYREVESTLSPEEKASPHLTKIVWCRYCRRWVRVTYENGDIRRVEPYM